MKCDNGLQRQLSDFMIYLDKLATISSHAFVSWILCVGHLVVFKPN